MHVLAIIPLAGLAVALPSPAIDSVPSKPENTANPPTFSPDRIISSNNLYDYLQKNYGSNHTIMLNNTGEIIDLSTITISQPRNLDSVNSLHSKREPPLPNCYTAPERWAKETQIWWDSWTPASSCLNNGLSPLPATQNIGWAHSKSITTDTGIDLKVIEDILSVRAGLTVTETWTDSGFINCQIPGHSIGQIWIQNKVVWGWIWERTCEICRGPSTKSCWGDKPKGGALAPIASKGRGFGVQFGCSTGYNNVQCDKH